MSNQRHGDQVHRELWPLPHHDPENQPHFLFIITPPYSGSTAMAQLINSSPRTMILTRRAEGQWLIPGLCGKNRWDPNLEVNYDSVKAVWLNRFQTVDELTQSTDAVIEKSPPNMMRIGELAHCFQNCSFLANNRNPYAQCASSLYRQFKADLLSPEQRIEILARSAHTWILRSQRIRDLMDNAPISLLTDEQFCESPRALSSYLRIPRPAADLIDYDSNVKVKDYDARPISNENERQIGNLRPAERATISKVLAERLDLMEHFGYELIA